MGSREELLRPSLADDSPPAAAPYSVQTTFLSGFFGGPFAAAALFAVNAVRMKRVARDAPVCVAMLAAIVGGWWLLQHTDAGAAVQAWLSAQLGRTGPRFGYRIAALVFVGIGYLVHRREQRTATLAGLDRPNGLIAGLLCIGLDVALLALLKTAGL
jgi:hypothetical protein